jgi:hypothetical protein
MVVPSVGHIEAGSRMVPMAVSLTDPNSDAADSDIGAFRDDHWFVADAQRIGKHRHRQEGTRKRANIAFFMAFSSGRDASCPDVRQNARFVFL